MNPGTSSTKEEGSVDFAPSQHTIALVQPRLEASGERQIIHGDLHPWNVHVSWKRLWALDFADVMWVTRAQDLVITLYYFQYRPDTAAN